MKTRFGRSTAAALALLTLLLLTATPSFADGVLYTNGPINGGANSWSISGSEGYFVSNSFTLDNRSTITSFSAGLWVYTLQESPTGLNWAILSSSRDGFSGSELASGSASLDAGNFSTSPVGFAFDYYRVFSSTVSGMSVNLPAGTYYLELFNASTAFGHDILWDQSSGLSTAFSNIDGAIPSESFTIYGTTSTAATPEPATMLMFGTGILGVAGAVRRRFSL